MNTAAAPAAGAGAGVDSPVAFSNPDKTNDWPAGAATAAMSAAAIRAPAYRVATLAVALSSQIHEATATAKKPGMNSGELPLMPWRHDAAKVKAAPLAAELSPNAPADASCSSESAAKNIQRNSASDRTSAVILRKPPGRQSRRDDRSCGTRIPSTPLARQRIERSGPRPRKSSDDG